MLNKLFNTIKHSNDITAFFNFCDQLTQDHSIEALEYHYSLLKEEPINTTLYNLLRRQFVKHGETGELFLLKKFHQEKNITIQSHVLQILGSYENPKHTNATRKLARASAHAKKAVLRNRAVIVLGWVGTEDDIDTLHTILTTDTDTEIRGWAATALMQLYTHNEKVTPHKTIILSQLKTALTNEPEDFVLECIIVSIQILLDTNFGLSNTSHSTASHKKILKAKEQALKALNNI